MIWDSNPGEGSRLPLLRNRPDRPWGIGFFSREKSSRGVALTTDPHLAPRLRMSRLHLYSPYMPARYVQTFTYLLAET